MGCGNFGGVGSSPELFGQGETDQEAAALLDRALDLGINVLDTADAYGGGRSETAIGRWLAARGSAVRDRVLVSSKVGNPVGDDFERSGLSAAHIERQVEASLGRLGVDHLDLYLPHAPDPQTPMLETLEAFDRLIAAGKVRAIGLSNHGPDALAESLRLSSTHGLARFEWVQNGFSLIDHREQTATMRICRDEGLGFTPFSPLCGGLLTGKYDLETDYPAGSRMTLRPDPYLDLWTRPVFDAIDELATVAADHGVSPAGMALAWVLAQPGVTAPVIGPRRAEHFAPVEEALALAPTTETLDALTAVFDAAVGDG
jgi:aryl-alcohol dehydrogenase-like predicted oxidoreductase